MAKKNVTNSNEQKFSKYLSYILRHAPESIGLTLGESGWVLVRDLINAINKSQDNNYIVDIDVLKQVVKHDEKQRYSLKDNDTYIRANQGHSVKDLNMNYEPIQPPDLLYHGTSIDNYKKIKESGCIKPMSRQYVHLSSDIKTASKVGARHGKAIVLVIDSRQAYEDGVTFYKSENNVCLSESVDVKYIKGSTIASNV